MYNVLKTVLGIFVLLALSVLFITPFNNISGNVWNVKEPSGYNRFIITEVTLSPAKVQAIKEGRLSVVKEAIQEEFNQEKVRSLLESNTANIDLFEIKGISIQPEILEQLAAAMVNDLGAEKCLPSITKKLPDKDGNINFRIFSWSDSYGDRFISPKGAYVKIKHDWGPDYCLYTDPCLQFYDIETKEWSCD